MTVGSIAAMMYVTRDLHESTVAVREQHAALAGSQPCVARPQCSL